MTEVTTPPAPAAEITTPQDAAARLETLGGDKQWRDKFFAGDAAARQEFEALTTLKAGPDVRIDAALAGAVNGGGQIEILDEDNPFTTSQLASVVANFREDNLSDATIKQVIKGEAVSADEHRLAKETLSRLVGDREWAKKLLSGDVGARRDHTLLHIIVNSPVKGSNNG
ncbi:MAG: hypothetical protein PSV22_04415 [Pseudolabrys sp.]|jgi:hypothetical protein|nr:hypothetical protein [Pseudolabrys sp.]